MSAALVLEAAPALGALALVRIELPVAPAAGAAPAAAAHRLPPLPAAAHACAAALAAVRALAAPGLPFATWPARVGALLAVAPRAAAGRLLKRLVAEQARLGLCLGDVRQLVLDPRAPLAGAELREALLESALAGLAAAGWRHLAGGLVLETDPFVGADGRPREAAALRLEAELGAGGAPLLVARASVVRFRQPAALPPGAGDAALAALGAALAGAPVRALPDLQPAVVVGARRPAPGEAAALAAHWAAAGCALPAGAPLEHVVDLRFEEDEDAAATPFPPAAVLSPLGLDAAHERLDAAPVRAALARAAAALGERACGVWEAGQLRVAEVRAWRAGGGFGAGAAAPALGLQTAAELLLGAAAAAAAAAGEGAAAACLGEVLDLEAAGDAGSEGGGGGRARPAKKPHARAGPELLSFLARMQAEAAEEAARAAAARPAAATAAAAGPAAAGGAAAPALRAALPTFKSKAPVGGAKRAAPKAAAGAPKPAAKKAAAPRKPASKKAAAAAASPAAADAADGASGSADGATAAAAPAAAPKAPRAKAPPVDVAALGMPALFAAGKLGALTVSQLKAFCKSAGLPVGGKKGDLEARAAAHLGAAAGAPALPPAAA
jgi:hypothetical protein